MALSWEYPKHAHESYWGAVNSHHKYILLLPLDLVSRTDFLILAFARR